MALQRLKHISSHLYCSSGTSSLEDKHPDDVVITMAIRSPLTKAKKGALKDTSIDELMLEMFKQAITYSKIDPGSVGDICIGTVLAPDPLYHARGAALAAGFPESVPVQVVNRFCSSGLMAVTAIANQIRSGQIEIGLAVGVESMSQNPDTGAPPQSESISASSAARDCLRPMGWTSENVAEDYGISREVMDDFAAKSFRLAEHAEKSGYFSKEIVPFTVYEKDPATGARTKIVVDKDDGIRYGTTKESLLKIRSAFPQWGKARTTGGNASQITDGAAAVMMMTRRKAEELGLCILGKHVSTAIAGVPPRVMGIGPVYAIPMVLKNTGLSISDVDLFEINEAFASQYVYCIQKLGLDPARVNPELISWYSRCTGTRQIATGLNELHRRKGKILVTSMCVGTGMGAAAVFVREA
ncbi:thiolase [Gyrodon lividus]|nr:thiolase [Gyrodon lividus]